MFSLVPPQYRVLAILALTVALYGTGWLKGHGSAMATWETTQAKADALALKATLDMERKGAEETVKYVTKTKVIHDQIESIPKVVTVHDDSLCAVPPDFSRMWNSINAATTSTAADSDVTPGASFKFNAQGKPETVGR